MSDKPKTWNDVVRSETPLFTHEFRDRAFTRAALTLEKLNDFLNRELEKLRGENGSEESHSPVRSSIQEKDKE